MFGSSYYFYAKFNGATDDKVHIWFSGALQGVKTTLQGKKLAAGEGERRNYDTHRPADQGPRDKNFAFPPSQTKLSSLRGNIVIQ